MTLLKTFGIFLFALMLSLSSSCTKKEETNDKVLNLAVTAEVKGMDPIFANDRYSSNEVARVYEGLFEYHYLKRPYQLIPNLAAEMPTVSEDGLTYTIKILPGVKFHDSEAFPEGKGRELVAEDFVYSLKRLADPKLQGLGWWLLDGKVVGLNEWRDKHTELPEVNYDEKVEGLQAIDKYTLQFKLTKPFPQFLYSLAMPFTFVVPREAVEKYGSEFLNYPVGTGPFVLPRFTQSNKIEYVKNPNFRDKFYPTEAAQEFIDAGYLKDAGKKLPLVDRIVINVMTESQPRWLNFQKGRVDYIDIPKDNFDAVVTPDQGLADELKLKGIDLMISPSLDVTYTAFNHDMEIFRNKKLRQAMSLAFDREGSNKLFYNGTALVAHSPVPPGVAGYMPDFVNPYVTRDVEKAKKLLAEAGFPEGKGLPEFQYDCPSSTVARQIGEYFKIQMAEIGIQIRVVTNPWPELLRKITSRQAEIWGIAWGADYPDAENFLQLLYGPNKSPGANGSGYDNAEFNELYKKAAVMQDTPERTALYEQMVKLVAEDTPWIYGFHRQSYTLKHGWLKNYVPSDFDAGQAQYLNIDKEMQAEISQKL